MRASFVVVSISTSRPETMRAGQGTSLRSRSERGRARPTAIPPELRIRISDSHERDDARIQLQDTASHSRCAKRPSCAGTSSLEKQRAQGKPGARCTRSRVCSVESTRVSHHRFTGITRPSLRNGFNGFLRALPGDRAFLPPSPGGIAPQGLISASGYQDHTTSPYAAALSSGSISIEPDAAASIASRAQRVVTIAIRPSQRARDGGSSKIDLPDGESGKFLRRGLDSPGGGAERGSDLPVGQYLNA
jgi:hypothetical protein